MKKENHEKGRSMIEMIGVLAVIGVLTSAGIAGYTQSMASLRRNRALEQLTTLTTNLRTIYAAQPNYEGLDTSFAVKAGAFSMDALNDKDLDAISEVTNAFSGEIIVAAADVTLNGKTKPNGGFDITFTELPQEGCIKMITADMGIDAGLVSVTVGSYVATVENKKLPITMSEAVKACSDTYNNTATWRLY